MKRFINKLITIKNVIGLMFIVFYFLYIGFSMSINRGNNLINIILLSITVIYLVVYVLTTFVLENKRVRKISAKTFKRAKKFIGFVNTLMILMSVITTPFKSFFTIVFSLISIFGYIMYVIFDLITSYLINKVKGVVKKYDYRR